MLYWTIWWELVGELRQAWGSHCVVIRRMHILLQFQPQCASSHHSSISQAPHAAVNIKQALIQCQCPKFFIYLEIQEWTTHALILVLLKLHYAGHLESCTSVHTVQQCLRFTYAVIGQEWLHIEIHALWKNFLPLRSPVQRFVNE